MRFFRLSMLRAPTFLCHCGRNREPRPASRCPKHRDESISELNRIRFRRAVLLKAREALAGQVVYKFTLRDHFVEESSATKRALNVTAFARWYFCSPVRLQDVGELVRTPSSIPRQAPPRQKYLEWIQ